ncbi:MAG: hypothetical protein GWO08_06610, partial [Gammaproteobacteria bacterium]|nr:hypothetical protein [Gammaproteobacteria bacterium]NIR93345.1 hypothetical protein [Gammaproteobacteria bacterium]NIW43605.1 hypothetical protein [Gammaproteobacteria bacterium]NIW98141.1 hypothetical protein [Phycisphaerae bacterium]
GTPDSPGRLSDGEGSLFIAVHNPYRFFRGSKWGCYYEYGLSPYRIKGYPGNDGIFYGTAVEGWYMYLTPVLF